MNMAKVKEITFVEAQKTLREKDAALGKAAVAHAKDPKNEAGTKALRNAALEFATWERYARSAKARENTTDIL